MAINTNPSTNPQLNGILSSTPSIAPTPLPPTVSPVGGFVLGDFQVPTSPAPTQPPANGQSGTGTLVVGGGTTPAVGAQPAAPATPAAPAGADATAGTTNFVPTTTNPVTPVTTTTTTEGAGSGMAFETAGFGKAERGTPISVNANGASFGFPSFRASAKGLEAPAISWGSGWTKVEKNGMWYMEHANGLKAIPAVEYRITPKPAEKVQAIKVANGWGKKFPDGTILVFDRKEGPYRLDPQGNKHKVGLGTHTFGGVKVRVFEASVVRTLDTDGNVNVFDSRGNKGPGTKRGRLAAALGSANAGASMGGGKTDSGPSTVSGPGGKGTLVGSGGAVTTETMTKDVQRLTELARTLTNEIRSGNVDHARLADLQAQLGALPSGILQAAGAAGTMTSDGRTLRHGGEDHGTTPPAPPTPGTSGSGTGTTVGNEAAKPGSTTTATGGGVTAPTAGVDANATKKDVAAGTKFRLDASVPSELQGKQARFAQLPDAMQAAVAKALGSDQGSAALKPDQLVAFSANGEVSLVEGGTVFTRHQQQVRGAGPGEEIALTVRPNRQPGSVGRVGADVSTRPPVSGGGGATTPKRPGTTGAVTMPTVAGVNATGGGANTNRISLFAAGGETRDVAFGGLNGSYTWKTLPTKAREALLAQLADASTAAGKAYASRTGAGWSIDPSAIIVLDAGYASFVNGLALVRSAATSGGGSTARPSSGPPAAGGGASSNTVGHDATRPPAGGGGVNPVAPGTPAPLHAH